MTPRLRVSCIATLGVMLASAGFMLIGAGTVNAEEPEVIEAGAATPVVLIILDEFPTANLMTADGESIDGRRFPNIAGFASGATWYRDNATAGDFTAWAVPSIFTGNIGDMYTLPTTEAQPDNIFTLLGPGRDVHSLEPLTELCPVEICPDGNQGEVVGAEDAIDFIKAKFEPFDPARLREWVQTMPTGPSTLSVVHVESPHQPLRFTPEGKTYPVGRLAMPTELGLNGWTIGDAGAAFVQQRHLIQSGYTDRLVGNILRKIKANGDFDDALVVLTADHGVSFDPHDLRRDATPNNLGATVNPPLIIKYPGQTEAVVSVTSTQTIDILPTVAKVLGETIPATDGKPVDQIEPGRVMTVSRHLQAPLDFTAGDIIGDREGVLADQTRRLGTGTLWKLGPRGSLFGRKVGPKKALPRVDLLLDRPDRIRRADSSNQVVPSLVSGTIEGISGGKVIAVGWNGKIVAVTRSFSYQGGIRFGAMIPPKVMHRGRNRVTFYLVGPGNSLRKIR